MALAAADYLTIEEWTGALDGEDRATASEIYQATGGSGRPYLLLTALRMLKRQRGTYIWHSGDIASASDRSSHSKNVDWLTQQIERLLGVMGALDNLPEDILDEIAESGSGAGLRLIGVDTRGPRVR